MVALNLLSLALSHITQTFNLNFWGSLIVIVFAIFNALIGVVIAWRLVNS